MKTISGTYTTAQIMTDDVEQYTIAQVKALCNNPIFKDEKVVCMPDIHSGKVTPIGFTATINNWRDKGIMPSIIGKGIGNSEWNYSVPHGSGIIMSRTDTTNQHTLSEYKKEMKDVYSPSINANTLDEAPFAYINIDQILPLIQDTVNVSKILKPIYNFKGGSK